MVLKLFGDSVTTSAPRVAVVLLEKKIPFEFVHVDFLKGEHKSPEYMKNQPYAKIPYIDDDGFILYESRAIARYLCHKYPNQGTKLVPTDLRSLALYEQATYVEPLNFEPPAIAIAVEKMYKPETDEAVLQENMTKFEKVLDVYEGILARQKYLAGDELTLADLFHLPLGSILERAGLTVFKDEKKPNVARWWKDISTRPSWIEIQGGIKSRDRY